MKKQESDITSFRNVSDELPNKRDKSHEAESVYDSTPEAILHAAAELKIPIPQTTDVVLADARKSLAEIFERTADQNDNKNSMWESVRHIARNLAGAAALESNLGSLLLRRYKKEEKLIWHSINSTLLSIELLPYVTNAECSVLEIGTAALIHDIGFLFANADYDHDETRPEFAKHIQGSVEMAKTIKAPEIVTTMVAQHHERLDGRGIPHGISGNEFLVCSQVLGLVEGFERIIDQVNNGHISDAPDESYIHVTLRKYNKAYDTAILNALISIQGFYPNGTLVELTDRSVCVVLKQNKGFPLRPLMQVVLDVAGNHPEKPNIIDLRASKVLSVVRTITRSPGRNQQDKNVQSPGARPGNHASHTKKERRQ